MAQLRTIGWRMVRAGLAVGLVLGGLGCSGVGQTLLDLSGTEVKVGADATHPAGFPLAPPPAGEIATSVRATMMGIETVTVQYLLPQTADVSALLDGYEQQMRAAGLEVERTDEADVRSVAGTRATAGGAGGDPGGGAGGDPGGGAAGGIPENVTELWAASTTSGPEGTMLSLVVIDRKE